MNGLKRGLQLVQQYLVMLTNLKLEALHPDLWAKMLGVAALMIADISHVIRDVNTLGILGNIFNDHYDPFKDSRVAFEALQASLSDDQGRDPTNNLRGPTAGPV